MPPKTGKSKISVVFDDLPTAQNAYQSLFYSMNPNRPGYLETSSATLHTNLMSYEDPLTGGSTDFMDTDTGLLGASPLILPIQTPSLANLTSPVSLEDVDEVYLTHLTVTATDERTTRVRPKWVRVYRNNYAHVNLPTTSNTG